MFNGNCNSLFLCFGQNRRSLNLLYVNLWDDCIRGVKIGQLHRC